MVAELLDSNSATDGSDRSAAADRTGANPLLEEALEESNRTCSFDSSLSSPREMEGKIIDFEAGTVVEAEANDITEKPRDLVIHGENGAEDTVAAINPRAGESLRDILMRLHPDLNNSQLDKEVRQVLKYNGDYGNALRDGFLDGERPVYLTSVKYLNDAGQITSVVSPDGKKRTDFVYSDRGRLTCYRVTGADGVISECAELNQDGDWVVTRDGESRVVKSVTVDRFGTITITDSNGNKLSHLTSGTDVFTHYEDGKPQESKAIRDGKVVTRFEYEYKDEGLTVYAIYPDSPDTKIPVTRAENREHLERLYLAKGLGDQPGQARAVDYDVLPEDIVVRNIVESAYGLMDHSVTEFDSGIPTNLGCARMVSEALLDSGMDSGVITANVDVLEAKLSARGWVMVPEAELTAGDVIIATGPGADQGHTGIFVDDGQVMHNSSSRGRFSQASYTSVFSNFQRRVGYRYIR